LRYLIHLFATIILCFLLQSCDVKSKQYKKSVFIHDPVMNAQLGKLFLAKNKSNPDVITLKDGLQYTVLTSRLGSQKFPDPNGSVTIYYRGEYIDGTVFDDKHNQKNPITFKLASVIPGLNQALRLMEVGSIWKVYIPPNLAFGEKGVPGLIGPNQTLIYYVHLIGTQKS
jgi:FKBP-type peptidyl-prolyl cis-trans isomerase